MFRAPQLCALVSLLVLNVHGIGLENEHIYFSRYDRVLRYDSKQGTIWAEGACSAVLCQVCVPLPETIFNIELVNECVVTVFKRSRPPRQLAPIGA